MSGTRMVSQAGDQGQHTLLGSAHTQHYSRFPVFDERDAFQRREAFAELARYRHMVGTVMSRRVQHAAARVSGPSMLQSLRSADLLYSSLSNPAVAAHHPRSKYLLPWESVQYATHYLPPVESRCVTFTPGGHEYSYLHLKEREKQRLGMVGDEQTNGLKEECRHSGKGEPMWEALLKRIKSPRREAEEERLAAEIKYTQRKFEALQLTRKNSFLWATEAKPEKAVEGAFDALSSEAEERVDYALNSSPRQAVLVFHENSNIEITGTAIRCLLPGAWLNDEVINLYMELLKERELREPKRFLTCHFFNTFFYNKLFKDKQRYDYKAVRRWTSQKKIGYLLSECDKILVPVHQDIHWCLAVVNIRDKKVEYLDSLKGGDPNVLQVLSRYFVDEVKDKSGHHVDVSDWVLSYPHDIPEQLNGCDCGMFMLKYADFHSRGASLCFSQEHMDFFRRKTTWEILQLIAT